MPNDSENKVLIDSNLLVYAFEPGSQKHRKVLDLFDVVVRNKTAAISVQNLAEFSSVILSRKNEIRVFDKLGNFTENLRQVFFFIAYSSETVLKAQKLVEGFETPFYDALLAATMMENGIRTIYTENESDFAKIPGIRAVNPFT